MVRRAAIAACLILAAAAPGCKSTRHTASGAEARLKPFVASGRPDTPGWTPRERIYHRRNCPHAKRIADANLIGWDCHADAQADGYRPCKVCLRFDIAD